jgi:hypothetical protein
LKPGAFKLWRRRRRRRRRKYEEEEGTTLSPSSSSSSCSQLDSTCTQPPNLVSVGDVHGVVVKHRRVAATS